MKKNFKYKTIKRIAAALLAAIMLFGFSSCGEPEPVKPCTEHQYGEFKVTKEPTCTEDGTKERICSVCDYSEIWYIQATGHSFSDWTVNKEGSCTEKGEEIRTCSKCGRIESRESAEAGHKFGEWKVVKEATGFEEGRKERKCSECGYAESAAIAKLAELNAEQISSKCAQSVFFIEVYGRDGYVLRTGSGFFINSDGMAVTNYHVITGACGATVTLSDGTVKNVEGIYDGSEGDDTAIIKVEGSGYKPLKLGNSEDVVAGQKVFAIGSPLGLDNTISEGIISNTNRKLDNTEYIQITAAISPGSSGGALLDAFGNVIGITSAYISDSTAQNLNLARRISLLSHLNTEDFITLEEAFPLAPASLWVGLEEMTVIMGHEVSIWVSQDLGAGAVISCASSDYSVCNGRWDEEWDGDWIGLTIEPISAGDADLTLVLKDSETEYDTKTLKIHIVDSIPYYDTYTTVPDFGVIMNIPELWSETAEGCMMHYYPMEGWYLMNGDEIFNQIMTEQGFTYETEYDEENWDYKEIYKNGEVEVMLFATDDYGYYIVAIS